MRVDDALYGSCWVGFVLAGECSQTSNRVCLKVGRDISEQEAKLKGYRHGKIVPHN